MDEKSLGNRPLSIDEAVALIKTNTYDKPTVNIRWMVKRIDFVEVAHNFTIPRVRLRTKEEYMELKKKYPGRRVSELTNIKNEHVGLRTSYEVELLKKTIKDNFRETSGHEYEKKNTRGISTVIDEEAGLGEAPRITKNTIAKEGSVIGSGSTVSTNSADGAGI